MASNNTRNRVFDYIATFIKQNGFAPSFREIAVGVGLKSSSTVFDHLKKLKESGRIDYKKELPRTITIKEMLK